VKVCAGEGGRDEGEVVGEVEKGWSGGKWWESSWWEN
nr:hypothetical protein [Tanacetum cinerariifolium]